MREKLVLIDGHSILNRAFYGVPELTNSEGLHTNAVYGFLNILFKILAEEQPQYLAVAFDLKAPTFRHKMYDAYKGTRKPQPPQLHEQVPVMKEVLTAMGVPLLMKEGYEADVPEYPTEKGFSVSDTIVLKADTLNMTLYVTDTPVTWRERTGSGPGKTEGVVRRLKDLYFAKKILEVTTTDCVYSNMVITSMNIKKSVEVGYAREIPIAFKKIEVTETATAEIPASYGKSGKTAKAAGKASTTAASTAGSSSSGGSSASGSSSSSSRGSVLYNAASSFGLLG